MHIFVTGGTGFVGTAVVKELLAHGHSVVALARSDSGATQLRSQGATPIHGTLADLDTLRSAATQADAVIHLAFVHDFSDFGGSCATDREAIAAMGEALASAGGNRALVTTSGTMLLPRGKVVTESDVPDLSSPLAAARGPSEDLCLSFKDKGVRASVVRLPPTTHGPGQSGFVGMVAQISKDKGVAAYVGEGTNRWCAGHRDDAAKVYRLAAEKGVGGEVFHAVGEEGVPVKSIVQALGEGMGIPVVSLEGEKAQEHYGWFAHGVTAENLASSKKTQEKLGWSPNGQTVLEDVPLVIEYLDSQA